MKHVPNANGQVSMWWTVFACSLIYMTSSQAKVLLSIWVQCIYRRGFMLQIQLGEHRSTLNCDILWCNSESVRWNCVNPSPTFIQHILREGPFWEMLHNPVHQILLCYSLYLLHNPTNRKQVGLIDWLIDTYGCNKHQNKYLQLIEVCGIIPAFRYM